MIILYNAVIRLYVLLARVASWFGGKAALWVGGRKHVFEILEGRFRDKPRVAWFHCASLGEFEQGRPVMEELKTREPDLEILLTFFSPSGYEIRKDYPLARAVAYLPADTKRNARRFIDAVDPVGVYFVKYEFWYHYLRYLKKKGIPVFLISGIFRRRHFFFRWYGKWFRRMLNCFDHLYVQTEESAGLLRDHGITRCTVSGDTRFDRVVRIAGQAREIPAVRDFKAAGKLLVAGSTWPPDEKILARYDKSGKAGYRMVIVPHETGYRHLSEIEKYFGPGTVRLSRLSGGEKNSAFRVLLIDSVGILSSVYRYAEIAYVGGGFGKGIHNILEPAVYGVPVIFGPSWQKFREAGELIRAGGAFDISGYADLEQVVDKLALDESRRLEGGRKAADYVLSGQGATRIILDGSLAELTGPPVSRQRDKAENPDP